MPAADQGRPVAGGGVGEPRPVLRAGEAHPLLLVRLRPGGRGAAPGSSLVSTGQTSWMPRRGTVRMTRCACPSSPTARRAALMRAAMVEFRHDAPAPDPVDQRVAGDQNARLAQEQVQEIEDLRLQRPGDTLRPEGVAGVVELAVSEAIDHAPSAAGRAIIGGAAPDHKPFLREFTRSPSSAEVMTFVSVQTFETLRRPKKP